jgi:hypothetical protein
MITPNASSPLLDSKAIARAVSTQISRENRTVNGANHDGQSDWSPKDVSAYY